MRGGACTIAAVGWITAACADATALDPESPADGAVILALEQVVTGLSSPVHLASPPDDARLFVVEQGGRVRVVRDGVLLPEPFLDIRSKVLSGGERGLLSVAFHPQYAANGRFYVNYTDVDGDTRVERYLVSADPDRADGGSATLVLAVAQPFSNHNGGLVTFGPDGMLYVGMGDGGSGGDPQGHGQNRRTLLGALLRLDVDGGEPYAVPPDNPYAGHAEFRGEIWAFGLRNPWRFAFDQASGMLYLGDVGQNRWEEINAVRSDAPAVNYGWNIMEGQACFGATTCDQTGLTPPVVVYATSGSSCSVVGGFVYRGRAVPELTGHYFYSDYCGGFLRSFRLDGNTVRDHVAWPIGDVGPVSSLGVDAAGELYVVAHRGTVYRVVRRP